MDASVRSQYLGNAGKGPTEAEPGLPETLAQNSLQFIEDYARERPISLALWALGIGFVLGWKLKPW